MAQLFSTTFNTLAKLSLLGAVGAPVALVGAGVSISRSPYNTNVGIASAQPVPFSHEHHATELGIDCRYCHSNVEKSSTAGVPPTQTCMSCHSQIWTNSPLLEPVRESYRTNTPIKSADGEIGWTQLNRVPDFVYFNHSIHINRGINCNICHGPVQQMMLTYKGQPFQMRWCLNCHRNPENYVAPREQVFGVYQRYQRGQNVTPEEKAIANGEDYQRTPEELQQGAALVQKYHVKKEQLTDCWICHR